MCPSSVSRLALRGLPLLGLLFLQTPSLSAGSPAPAESPSPAPLPARSGSFFSESTEPDADSLHDAYSDTFSTLKGQVRDFERDPANRYTHCIRSIAVYECLSYGSDGSIRRQRTKAEAHGTGFAYQEQNGETYLLTNQHVVDWPAVTDGMHKVDDIPAGCKRVSESLKIVDNEQDDYTGDDVPLTRVVVDDALDAAVVKAKAKLRLMPYRLGSSAGLQAGDAVMVRGFPLGAFLAVNTGKVVNPYDRDEYKDWDHLDFIIDAPLSSGNSGSPVLAISNRTGEYELVGIFHASYSRGNALNAVIGIDQLRDLMFTLKKPKVARGAADPRPGPRDRAALDKAMTQPAFIPYFNLGPLTVGLRRVGDILLYEVFSKRFPLDDHRLMVLSERPSSSGFGTVTRVWFGGDHGLKAYEVGGLDRDSQTQFNTLVRRLHRLTASILQFRALVDKLNSTREAVEQRSKLEKLLAREAISDAEMAQLMSEMADRLGPKGSDQALSFDLLLAGISISSQAIAGSSPGPVDAGTGTETKAGAEGGVEGATPEARGGAQAANGPGAGGEGAPGRENGADLAAGRGTGEGSGSGGTADANVNSNRSGTAASTQ